MSVCFGVAHDYLCRIGFVTYLHAKDAVKETVIEVAVDQPQSDDPDEVQNDNGEAV